MRRATFPAGRRRAGFAIGPILLMLALIGIVAMVVAAGTGDFGTTSTIDRISANIASQADLIRTKINQCNMQYTTAYSLCLPSQPCSVAQTDDPYPQSNASGTVISSLLCDPVGTQNLWTDTILPQTTVGFNDWYYLNASATGGGRCIWTQPSGSPPANNTGVVTGLKKAAAKFANGTSYNASSEVIYDPSSTSQKFIVWITTPVGTPDPNCLP